MNKSKVIIKISQILIIIFLPIAILLSILQYYSHNESFYMKEFRKYDVAEVTTMSEKDLSRVAKKLISYLKDESKDLEIKAVVKGEVREVFGQREKQHMIDVKNLFIKGRRLRNISLGLALLAIAIILLISKNRKKDIYQAFLSIYITPLLFMIVLYILLKIDFNKYFTYFHKIFFANDLWLLNPETDVLIQMLPLEFFIDISIGVISWFAGILVALAAIVFMSHKKVKYK